ncbi:prohead protease/major capsid protein fusion protein [Leisingera sp.]|uniref:prohead protease/major capsid protein fusion protein n=1 Tax=Leisingera sp. TaxID=1879318 RepID=UPI002B274EC7|nr:prohead protease/major capsid protein fusion protein [Leisingera sp.]
MAKDTVELPLIGREATVVAESIDNEERTIEVVWTTGATVQRYRWEGWDVVEYDEELEVSERALRLDRLNGGAPFLDSHRSWDSRNTLGAVVPDSVRIKGGKGTAKIRLTAAEDAKPIIDRILERTINKVSVGYRVHQYDIRAAEKKGERDLYRAIDWEPYEISAVAMPADPGANIRSEEPGRQVSRFACVLHRQGETAAAAAMEKGTTMSKPKQPAAGQEVRNAPGSEVETRAPEAPATPAATPAPAAPEARETPEEIAARAVVAERERTGAITDLCRRHGLEDAFEADLIRSGATIEQVRAKVLDKLAETDPLEGRTYEPAPAQVRGESANDIAFRDALHNALMHRINPGVNELSDAGRQFRGLTLLDIGRENLERRGVSTRGMARMEIAAQLFGRAAGYHSTSDFPTILANVANQTLRAAYDEIPRTFQAWARRETITDFKPVTRVQLSGAPDLEKVLESGEFQYGTMGEAKEVYALSTYGKIIGFTRQMLINDDLGAFTRVTQAFGARAADLEGDIVYAILQQNPAMGDGTNLFHADHGNLGAAAVINEASLTAAYRAYAKQTGIEGHKISVNPSFLIAPPGQRVVEARKILTSTTPNSTSEVNVYANQLQVVSERRLIPDSGQDPWFLSAMPTMIDTVEYAYLDGNDGVFTETRTGFEVDGIEIKARHDFAAKAIDHRGMYKNPGAAPA